MNTPTLAPRLQAVDWSKGRIAAFQKAYSDGDVKMMVMSNFLAHHIDGMGADEISVLYGVPLLTVPLLDPTHFHFTGNRPYQMQVVSNGECFGVLSHERVSHKHRSDLRINMVRMEVITATNLPFLQVSPPDERQLKTIYADWLEWTLQGFKKVASQLPDETVDFCRSMSLPLGQAPGPIRIRIEQGQDPREVLSDWISSSLTPTPARPVPR